MIEFKLVYYGPGLAGKATSMTQVYNRTRQRSKGNLLPLPTVAAGAPSFNFMSISVPRIGGCLPRLSVYRAPDSLYDDPARRSVLAGVDGIVFVADSQRERADADAESFAELARNLAAYGRDAQELPFVMQYNKRDTPSALPVAELDALLMGIDCPRFESVATTGVGVFEAIRAVGRSMFAAVGSCS